MLLRRHASAERHKHLNTIGLRRPNQKLQLDPELELI